MDQQTRPPRQTPPRHPRQTPPGRIPPSPADFRLCRTWLFRDGAAPATADAGTEADVLIQDLEDFTTPAMRPAARDLAPALYRQWRAAGRVACVRINPLAGGGRQDLAAVMAGAPDIVALPKVDSPARIVELDALIGEMERDCGLNPGSTAILPNIESARGILATVAIATASPRVIGCLMASEDLAADLGAERDRDAAELDHARGRFLIDCVAAGVIAVDCPYTWSDAEGAAACARRARRLGYTAKSLVDPGHAGVINAVLTPSPAEITAARRIVDTFDAARARGAARVELDGVLVELPRRNNAARLLARAHAFITAGLIGDPS